MRGGVIRVEWVPDPETKARRTDPDTAHEAAYLNVPIGAAQRRQLLFIHFQYYERGGYEGLHNGELEGIVKRFGINIVPDALTTRVSEMHKLAEAGGKLQWLEDRGVRRMGPNARKQIVWFITLKGLAGCDPLGYWEPDEWAVEMKNE